MLPVFAAGAGENPAGDPPSAPPNTVEMYTYAGGLKYGIQWRNGDVTASTQASYGLTEGEYISGTSPPGDTTRDLGITVAVAEANGWSFWVRHVKNGQYSVWVEATGTGS